MCKKSGRFNTSSVQDSSLNHAQMEQDLPISDRLVAAVHEGNDNSFEFLNTG